METVILVIRHGLTAANASGRYMGWSIDEDLNPKGRRQAERLGARLRLRTLDAVYSSPLRRALSTAQVLAEAHSVDIQIMEDLGEMHLGSWEGMHVREVKAAFPELWRQWIKDPTGIRMPGGEQLEDVQVRAVAALDEVVRTNPGRRVALVTHQVVVRLLVAHCLGVSPSIYRRIEVSNASITAIREADGHLRLASLNDVAHLETPSFIGR